MLGVEAEIVHTATYLPYYQVVAKHWVLFSLQILPNVTKI